MKDNKKSRIDIHETPYELYLVIANKYTTLEELQEIFTYPDGSELTHTGLTEDKNGYKYQAVTAQVKRKSDKRHFLLVWQIGDNSTKVEDRLLDLINLAAHEASHVMLDIYYAIGENVDLEHQEQFAYQQAYITTLILKNWMNK